MTYKEMIDKLTKEEALILVKECSSYSQILRKMGMASVSGSRIELLTQKLTQFKIVSSYDRYHKVYNKNVKEDVFKIIDTPEKAYWLGFLAADGYTPRSRHMVRIHISVQDEKHLNSFISFIRGDLNSKYYPTSSKHPSVMFSVHNKEISDSIKQLGIVSPKTNSNLFIDFKNEQLTLAYLLGFYDGDGTSGNATINCGNIDTLESIKAFFGSGTISHKENHWGSVYTLYFGIDNLKRMFKSFKGSLNRKRYIRDHKNLNEFR